VWLFLKYAKAGLPDVAPVELQTDPDAPMTFAY
jgi:cytochrome d ubiquinol oxidase subunit I